MKKEIHPYKYMEGIVKKLEKHMNDTFPGLGITIHQIVPKINPKKKRRRRKTDEKETD